MSIPTLPLQTDLPSLRIIQRSRFAVLLARAPELDQPRTYCNSIEQRDRYPAYKIRLTALIRSLPVVGVDNYLAEPLHNYLPIILVVRLMGNSSFSLRHG
jgi:hypothetical protein